MRTIEVDRLEIDDIEDHLLLARKVREILENLNPNKSRLIVVLLEEEKEVIKC